MRSILSAGFVFLSLFLIFPSMQISTSFAEASAVAAAATCQNPYIVQTGDTLTAIAQKCNVSFSALLAANPTITTPNLVFPGQSINLPQGTVPVTGGPTYTVISGDRLFSIAQRFNTSVQAILNTNTWIANPNLILPGWVIVLPSGSSGPGIPNTGGSTYTVVAGDTLSGIAQRFNTTTAALLSANPFITNRDLIITGWVIKIQ